MPMKISVEKDYQIVRKAGKSAVPNPFTDVIAVAKGEMLKAKPVDDVQTSPVRKVTDVTPGKAYTQAVNQVRRAALDAGVSALIEFAKDDETATEFRFCVRTKIARNVKPTEDAETPAAA